MKTECLHCGGPLTGRQRMYCSPNCRVYGWRKNQKKDNSLWFAISIFLLGGISMLVLSVFLGILKIFIPVFVITTVGVVAALWLSSRKGI